jgi:hypothetical protein
MAAHRFKFNIDKTDIILTGTAFAIKTLPVSWQSVHIGSTASCPTDHIKLPGVGPVFASPDSPWTRNDRDLSLLFPFMTAADYDKWQYWNIPQHDLQRIQTN